MKTLNLDPSQNAYIDETRSLRVQAENSSQFGEFLVAQRTPVIELNSSYGTSALRDIEDLTGSASVTPDATGEITIATGATASSVAQLDSAETARYIPGYGAEIGIGMRFTAAPVGEQVAKWGGLSVSKTDGVYFTYDAVGLGVALLVNGVEEIVRRADWNIDKVDGTGPSGFNLDETASGYIYQIDFTWYGYGSIKFSVVGSPVGLLQRPIPLHVFTTGDYVATSVQDPNMLVVAQVENGATASNFSAQVGGRQYSIVGQYRPKFRYTGDFRGTTEVTTTPKPFVSFRFKSAFANRSVKLDGLNVANTGNTACFAEVRTSSTLTGAVWGVPGNYDAADTAIESDTTATALTGGRVVYPAQPIPSAKDAQFAFTTLDLDLPALSTFHLVLYTEASTTNVITSLQLREEW